MKECSLTEAKAEQGLCPNAEQIISLQGLVQYLRTPVTGGLLGRSGLELRGGRAAAEVVASAEEASRALMAAALCLAASRTARWSFRTPAAGAATVPTQNRLY